MGSQRVNEKLRLYGSRQGELKNRRKSRSRRGNEADRRRAEAALWRVAKAEVFFAPKSVSSAATILEDLLWFEIQTFPLAPAPHRASCLLLFSEAS
jgi:hypothetical protein